MRPVQAACCRKVSNFDALGVRLHDEGPVKNAKLYVLTVLFGSFLRGANEGAENEAKLFGQKQLLNQKLRLFQATTFTEKYNFFSILCLTRDFIRQGHAREKGKVYRATRTRSQAIDRG